MQVQEALEKFLVQLSADGRSQHTIKQYRRHVLLFATWARDVGACGDEIEKLDHDSVAKFLASTMATGRAGGGTKRAVTSNALRSSIRNFLRYVHQAGFTANDAGRLVRRARCSPPPPRAMTDDEQKKLLDALAAGTEPEAMRDHALFHLMLATGLRLGSAIGLDVEDVDLSATQISVKRAKNDAPDIVYLNDSIKAHLTKFLVGRTTGPLFLANGKRVSMRHIQRRFSQWLAKAGIPARLSPHCARHAFAMRLYAKTADLQLVRAALNHRSIASTTIYARTSVERIRAAL